MSTQIDYYNQFGREFEGSILACPEPEVWTTDYASRGRVYRDMKQRIGLQYDLIARHFDRQAPVLDIGCGFGRQAVLLAKNGFTVTGVDTSPVFVDLARRLCEKHGHAAEFLCANVMAGEVKGPFRQILLLDVLEHVPPPERRRMLERIAELAAPSAKLLLSIPIADRYLSSWIDNRLRKRVTQHFDYFRNREEHPYPIPSRREMARLSRRLFALEFYCEANGTAVYVFGRAREAE